MTTKLDLSGRRFMHDGEGPFTIAEVQAREAAKDIIIPMASTAYLSEAFDTLFDSFREEMPEGFVFYITASTEFDHVMVHTNAASFDLASKIVDVAEEVLP